MADTSSNREPGGPPLRRILTRIGILLEMIKFQHTVFALPFAAMSAALAVRCAGGAPITTYLWIVVAMVAARSAAMAFNRLVDREIDAANPRTAARALPLGLVTPRQVGIFTGVCAGIFFIAARALNPLAFALAPLALVIILGYSFTKRFTFYSHWVLGLALAIAPVGAWIAVAGSFALPPILLAVAVACWTAGFDIIYSCQDTEFDANTGLHSVPQQFGVSRALQISSLCHAGMVACLVLLMQAAGLGPVFGFGVVCTAVLLVYEHRLVQPDDLSRVDAAFFTTNGLISLGLMICLLLDLAIRP